ncbi:unnamed protein product [Pleuronectes platessa]|uniref:Uncharacterized protein n=1 Tax=Pleuronectes platessa TaxID=8262 RepID=A0A9N7TT44_PLEPL|nr:unnamed protein product [Pleuronectes platessa]
MRCLTTLGLGKVLYLGSIPGASVCGPAERRDRPQCSPIIVREPPPHLAGWKPVVSPPTPHPSKPQTSSSRAQAAIGPFTPELRNGLNQISPVTITSSDIFSQIGRRFRACALRSAARWRERSGESRD